MSFCPKCGNLMNPIRKADNKIERFCPKCSDTPEQVIELVDDEKFLEKLKNQLRTGREEKPLRSLSRILNLQELQLHETLKVLDERSILPYGYYDKIEKVYVRTHLIEELDPELLIDMVYQSYAYDIFGAKGLTNYISLGKQTSVRKVLQSLHELRKKGRIRGKKRGNRWLWRFPHPDEDSNSPFFPKSKKKLILEEKEPHETNNEDEGDSNSKEGDNNDSDDDDGEDGGVYFADPYDDDDY